MADIKQIKVGSTTYDIKAKAFDGTLPIANGGTNATTTAAAKVNLNLCAEGQDVRLANYSGASQIWGLRAKCVNTNNTDYNNKDIGLIADNSKLLLYDHSSDGGAIWSIAPDDYLKLSGGQMTGAITWKSGSIAEFSDSPPYILGIESFSNGGATKWKTASSVKVGGLTTSRKLWGQDFNGTANVNGNIFVQNTDVTKGTNPSADKWRYITFADSASLTAETSRMGWIANRITTGGLSETRLVAYRYASNSTDAIMIKVNMPQSGNGYIDVSGANVSTAAVRNISYGTGTPSGGSAGQVYIQYFN